jgi:hypothetical protein
MDSSEITDNKRGPGVGNNGNLIPARKGEVRNPKGRPRGTVGIVTAMKRAMKAIDSKDTEQKRKLAVTFAEAMIRQAMKGNAPYAKEIMARLEGPIPSGLDDVAGASLDGARVVFYIPKRDGETAPELSEDPEARGIEA